MLFVHLAREELVIAAGGETQYVPYVDLERTLPAIVRGFFSRHHPDACCVITGPGGFTPLRIGTVMINILQQRGSPIQLYACTKIDVYRFGYTQCILPAQGLISIGQKKNMLLYDFSNDTWSLVHADQGKPTLAERYFVDWMLDHPLLVYTLPEVQVQWLFEDETIVLQYLGKTVRFLPKQMLTPQTEIAPEYFLMPTIG